MCAQCYYRSNGAVERDASVKRKYSTNSRRAFIGCQLKPNMSRLGGVWYIIRKSAQKKEDLD